MNQPHDDSEELSEQSHEQICVNCGMSILVGHSEPPVYSEASRERQQDGSVRCFGCGERLASLAR